MLQLTSMWCLLAAGLVLIGCGSPTEEVGTNPILWSVAAENATTVPLVVGSLTIVGGGDGVVRALDRETGVELWRRSLIEGYPVRGRRLAAAGDVVIVPHFELWGLDVQTGQTRWVFAGPSGSAGVRDPVVAGTTVFATSQDGWVSAVDIETGAELWSVDLAESAWPPAVSDELVLYGTRGWVTSTNRTGSLGAGHLVALRRSDGAEAWRFPLPDSVGFPLSGGAISGGVVWQDRVVVASKSSWVYAVSLADGSLIWSAPNGESPVTGGYTAPPGLIDDVVVLGRANDSIDAWSAQDGTRRWAWGATSALQPPMIVGDRVYVVQGGVTVGDSSGQILWSYRGPGLAYFSGGVGSDGTVYALASGTFRGEANRIQAIRPPLAP